jgi:hypothetical protein
MGCRPCKLVGIAKHLYTRTDKQGSPVKSCVVLFQFSAFNLQ